MDHRTIVTGCDTTKHHIIFGMADIQTCGYMINKIKYAFARMEGYRKL